MYVGIEGKLTRWKETKEAWSIKKQSWECEMYIETGPDRSSEIIHSTSFILHKILLGFSTDWIKITANVKVLKIMKIKDFLCGFPDQ